MNLLFVCSRNKWRSPTAEEVFRSRQGYNARSAGTEPSANIKLTAKLIEWADLIFVMEKKHRQRIVQLFPSKSQEKRIIILDIEDEYQYMDEELVETIKLSVEPYLRIKES